MIIDQLSPVLHWQDWKFSVFFAFFVKNLYYMASFQFSWFQQWWRSLLCNRYITSWVQVCVKKSTYIRVGQDFSKYWRWPVIFTKELPWVWDLSQKNFRSLGCVTAVRPTFKVLANHYIRSNFKSCHFWLQLKIQSSL